MRTVSDPAEVQAWASGLRRAGQRIGFVPTMGFLHRGHTSLMDMARRHCDQLVVSIYVNPLQFGPGEDLDHYPRDPEGDARKCREHGVDLLFTPTALYADGHSTTVHVEGLTQGLCGARRPGHFDGVTTVVARLFGVVQPHVAVFGEKDYQQLAVIRRMTRDLALGVQVLGAPLVRDVDGLALSSRNSYLSPEQRRRALSLHQALHQIRHEVADGERDAERLIARALPLIQADSVDYLELRDDEDLQPVSHLRRPTRALVAAQLGHTRLIDNLLVFNPSAQADAP